MSMEEASKDNSAPSGNVRKSKLRYPLRSATKQSRENPSPPDPPNLSASKSGRTATSVSKSTGVLDVSVNKSSSKPPRRLSNPPKSATGSASKPAGHNTPVSQSRAKRNISYNEGKSGTPVSDTSKSSSRRKFRLLSSPSYWLSQIRISEAESKHSVSLGFFKLAMDAGCEDIQRMQYELKSYIRRQNLVEHQEMVKDLLYRYNVSEDLEQLQVSESYSQMPGEVTPPSDDDVISSFTRGSEGGKAKSKDNTDEQVLSKSRKASAQKNSPANKMKGSSTGNSMKSKVGSDNPQKPKHGPVKGTGTPKNQKKNSAADEGLIHISPIEETAQENKENIGAAHQVGEIDLKDE